MIDSDSDLDVVINQEYVPKRRRNFRRRVNFCVTFPGTIGHDIEFKEKFRLSTECVAFLENRLGQALQHSSLRNMALSPRQQLLLFLRFVGTNGYYHLVADAHGVSKATVCRVVRRVSGLVLNELENEYIRWPGNGIATAIQFQRKGGFPCVAACIDGTHIEISAPSHYEQDYVNRYHTHSINCLAAAGPDYMIYFISSRWPGSVADARVLRNSQ